MQTTQWTAESIYRLMEVSDAFLYDCLESDELGSLMKGSTYLNLLRDSLQENDILDITEKGLAASLIASVADELAGILSLNPKDYEESEPEPEPEPDFDETQYKDDPEEKEHKVKAAPRERHHIASCITCDNIAKDSDVCDAGHTIEGDVNEYVCPAWERRYSNKVMDKISERSDARKVSYKQAMASMGIKRGKQD